MKKGVILCILFLACAINTKYKVQIYYDEFDNYTHYSLSNNILAAANLDQAIANIIDLQIHKLVRSDTVVYALNACHSGKDWMLIKEEKSLILLIDNKKYSLTKNESKRKVLNNGWVAEHAFYYISPAMLKTIAFAKQIKLKLSGENFFLIRHIQPETIAKYQRFYNEYVNH